MALGPNQTFRQMNRVALGWLKNRDPVEIARNAGVAYDSEKQIFHVSSMGMDLTVSYPDYEITPQVSGWHKLLILHYLHLADGQPLIGKEISFSQMTAGMVRGGGIDRKVETAISRMENLDEQTVTRICTELGAERIPSNADIAFRILFLPRFPVTLKIWLPDDEFSASGRLLLDASADHYMTIEDAVTMAEILIEKIAVPEHERSFAI